VKAVANTPAIKRASTRGRRPCRTEVRQGTGR
jgi:hypothetical protein